MKTWRVCKIAALVAVVSLLATSATVKAQTVIWKPVNTSSPCGQSWGWTCGTNIAWHSHTGATIGYFQKDGDSTWSNVTTNMTLDTLGYDNVTIRGIAWSNHPNSQMKVEVLRDGSWVTAHEFNWSGTSGWVSRSINHNFGTVNITKVRLDYNAPSGYAVTTDVGGSDSPEGLRITGTCTAPSITGHPSSQTKCEGDSVTFSVSASGTPLLYQWRKGGVDISGANDASYTINSVESGHAGNYTCYVWNGCGNVTSNAATLTVNPLPTAPTSASANPETISLGQSSTLSYVGGSGDELKWYSGSCGGTYVGSGQDFSVSPTQTTTYYCRWESECGNSVCAEATVTVTVSPLDPVPMISKDIGGLNTPEYDPVTGAGQMGVEDGIGENNIGLLVKTCGTVTAVGDGFFYIDDGENARDFSIFGGVRVRSDGLTKPNSGDYVCITGISSIMNVQGRVFRSIRPRIDTDIEIDEE